MEVRVLLAASLLVLIPAGFAWPADTSLTIYNQEFAVVRQNLHLDLQKGENHVSVNDITMHLEPDSVILRDLAGKWNLQVLEQNYRNDPVSEKLLLSLNEGKTLVFDVTKDNKTEEVKAKLIRSGYAPHSNVFSRYSGEYMAAQAVAAESTEPVLEYPDGTLRFGLPGKPHFPPLPDDTILKPALTWTLGSDAAGPLDAELSYVTGGMSWEAGYNLVAPKQGDDLDLVGWVTMDNQSGKSFKDAGIKLMAGDVSKIQQGPMILRGKIAGFGGAGGNGIPPEPPVTEKKFDEYHLYTLARTTTLHDRETKQVEFVRANGIKAGRLYVYDGWEEENRQYYSMDPMQVFRTPDYGTRCQKKVWVMREIKNDKSNGLGIALPAGRMRFYQRDDADGHLEFVGEKKIDHTPADEMLRVYTGNAFDLVGERRQVSFQCSVNSMTADERFEIKLRNHKKEPVTVCVVEHLYRYANWKIMESSDKFTETDSKTMEFRVPVNPEEEKTVTYWVHYSLNPESPVPPPQ